MIVDKEQIAEISKFFGAMQNFSEEFSDVIQIVVSNAYIAREMLQKNYHLLLLCLNGNIVWKKLSVLIICKWIMTCMN